MAIPFKTNRIHLPGKAVLDNVQGWSRGYEVGSEGLQAVSDEIGGIM